MTSPDQYSQRQHDPLTPGGARPVTRGMINSNCMFIQCTWLDPHRATDVRAGGPGEEKRSVVILRPDDYDEWLHARSTDGVHSMLTLYPSQELTATPMQAVPKIEKPCDNVPHG